MARGMFGGCVMGGLTGLLLGLRGGGHCWGGFWRGGSGGAGISIWWCGCGGLGGAEESPAGASVDSLLSGLFLHQLHSYMANRSGIYLLGRETCLRFFSCQMSTFIY